MRIVFIGSVYFSKIILEELLSLGADIVAVVTKSQSAYNSDFEDLSVTALSKNIPFKFVNDINHENNVKWIKDHNPDIIFCFGWSSLLKKQVLTAAPMGVVGYHPSLLPDNKGRHPLIWAKVLGLQKTGSTFFFMDEGADSGDILHQESFEINFEDDAKDIYQKMIVLAVKQVNTFLPSLINKTYVRRIQPVGGNSWRKRGKIDGLIDFRMSTASICNLVRALTRPYIGAHCKFDNDEIKVWKVEPGNYNVQNFEPGKVLSVKGQRIEIKTADSSIFLVEHELISLPQINQYFI